VILAMGDGRRAAKAMDEWLKKNWQFSYLQFTNAPSGNSGSAFFIILSHLKFIAFFNMEIKNLVYSDFYHSSE